jgi:hypothetical protein
LLEAPSGDQYDPRGEQVFDGLPVSFPQQPSSAIADDGFGAVAPGNDKRDTALVIRRRSYG